MAPEQNNHHNLDQEIKDLIFSLTKRLTNIQRPHKSGSSSTLNHENEDDNGVSVITLTGNNVGATMRGDTTDKPEGMALPEQEESCTYVNSNFQAINNSIMFDGSYDTNDPGVHLDITDYLERDIVSPRRGKSKVNSKNERGSSKGAEHRQVEHSGVV